MDRAIIRSLWRRFGMRPAFAGRRVLELGCGRGVLAWQMASEGADVLAVDLDPRLIDFARRYIEHRPVSGSLRFLLGDLLEIDLGESFDLVISQNTREHVQEPAAMLRLLGNLLAPLGQIWAGFSPLYYSPHGDHARTGMRVPWAHTLPWPVVRRVASPHRGHPVLSRSDLGLNALTARQFRRHVRDAGMRFHWIAYNRGDRRLMPALNALRRVPLLERYATVGIYAVLGRS